jgi:hypothetical protein
LVQAGAELFQVRLDVLGDSEVDQGQALWGAALELSERPIPDSEVELRRRRGRGDVVVGLDPDSRRVTGVEDALAPEIADVVTGVAGAGKRLEAERVVADGVDIRFRDRRELAPKVVERVAVEASRAALEPRGIDQVRCADFGDVDLQCWVFPDEGAGGAGVIEVDVAEEQVADL